MCLNMVLSEILFKYSHLVSELALFSLFCISLGLPEDFGIVAKRGLGQYLTLESHLICSLLKSCMKTKVETVCFTLNSVFLIGPKNDHCTEEKDAQ